MDENAKYANIGKANIFTAANSTTNQLLYSPSIKDGVPLSGWLVDFTVETDITSIPELTPTAASALATRNQQALEYYDIAKTHPSKRFVMYWEYPDAPGVLVRRAIVLLWNRRPYFTLDLLPRLSRRNTVMVGEKIKIWGRFEDDPATAWNGALQGTDTAQVTLAASEEAANSDANVARDPTINTLKLVEANTQYPLVIPDGTRRFYLKCRGDAAAQDVVADFRYAWQSGVVATGAGNYEVVGANVEEGESNVYLVGKTLYLASSTANTTVILRTWK